MTQGIGHSAIVFVEGEKDASSMGSTGERHEPACMVAHNMVNVLSDIIGHCDLLSEKIEPGTEAARRLATVRDLAESAVKQLTEHQRALAAESRKVG
jgi:hypothetical protein